jgi:hypothetical protein
MIDPPAAALESAPPSGGGRAYPGIARLLSSFALFRLSSSRSSGFLGLGIEPDTGAMFPTEGIVLKIE